MALGNGALGVNGVAPDAELVFIKIQSDANCGSPSLDGDLAGALDAMLSFKRDGNPLDIINMSLGVGVPFAQACGRADVDLLDPGLFDALRELREEGVQIFTSSGNNGFCDGIGLPACHPDVISVGASYDANIGGVAFRVDTSSCSDNLNGDVGADPTTFADKPTVYSNSADILDIYAPAHCAFTAAPFSSTENCFGGTSSASPFAAGVGALVLEKNPSADLRKVLAETGDPITEQERSTARTKPRVNALKALEIEEEEPEEPEDPDDDKCERGSLFSGCGKA